MIASYNDYVKYLEADRISLGRKGGYRASFFDAVWRFQILMRTLEYCANCKRNRLFRVLVSMLYRRECIKLGFTIPINTFGPGLSIAHIGTIVVNGAARIGANCRIHVCVNIGTEAGRSDVAPIIGDNCYIGPGAKIFGKIEIGPYTAIGANAVVNKSFHEGNATLGGVPARVISTRSSKGLLKEGWSLSSS